MKCDGDPNVCLKSLIIQVSLLGFEGPLRWSDGSGLVAIEIELPDRWGKLFLLKSEISAFFQVFFLHKKRGTMPPLHFMLYTFPKVHCVEMTIDQPADVT